jgi:hypothetical protein
MKEPHPFRSRKKKVNYPLAQQMIEKGYTLAEIARSFGVCDKSVRCGLARRGYVLSKGSLSGKSQLVIDLMVDKDRLIFTESGVTLIEGKEEEYLTLLELVKLIKQRLRKE